MTWRLPFSRIPVRPTQGVALVIALTTGLYLAKASLTPKAPRRSVTDMATTAKKPWADGPFKLIETPRFRKGNRDLSSEHEASAAASEMALVHNIFLRIVNCIYRQALYIPTDEPSTVRDFMTMINTFNEILHLHHANEEKFYFPWLEEDIGCGPGEVMGDNVKQHHAFLEGMKAYEEYVHAVREQGAAYDGAKLLRLMDVFLKGDEGLYTHLNDEIATFERLEEFGNKIDWKRWNARMLKQALGDAELNYHVPLVITNCDVSYEDYIHKSKWPPFPWIAHFVLRLFKIPKHKNVWRFCSCDSRGLPQELPYAQAEPPHRQNEANGGALKK